MSRLSSPAWSPYTAGILIGLLQVPAFLLMDTALGTSSSYVTLAGNVAQWFDPVVEKLDYFARHLGGAKNWWQVALVAGIVLGAFLSSRLSGLRRGAESATLLRFNAMPASPAARRLVYLAGGFLIVFGARIADGCTTGHGLSGLAQLALASTIVVTFIFAGGIGTAFLLARREN